MNFQKHTTLFGFLLGLLFLLYFTSLGLIIVLNWRGLYYHDISALGIDSHSGFDRKDITLNFNALMDYSSPLYQGNLSFPTLISSPEGLQHFKEVKDLFLFFYRLFPVTQLLIIVLFYLIIKRRNYQLLKISAITSISLPLLIGLICSLSFDSIFLLFHKFVFRNNYWIFSPEKDPIILMLPKAYFLHCTYVILATVAFGAMIQYYLYRSANFQYRNSSGYNRRTTKQ